MSSKRRNALRLAGTGVRLAGGGGLTFLLRDDFTTAAAAPLTSPRTAEPGPGTLTLVQTDGQFSIADGKLNIPAQSTPVWGDQGGYGAGVARSAGKTLVARHKYLDANSGNMLGWLRRQNVDVGGYTGIAHMVGWSSSSVTENLRSVTSVFSAVITGVEYTYAIALRSTGAFYFIRNGAYIDWTLGWINVDDSTATVYPAFTNLNSSATLDTFRVLDLPAPFDSDFGLATQRLAGARSAGDTLTHTANCLLEFVCTTRPSADQIEVRLRAQDTSNYWQVTVDSSGNLDLDEVVAGVVTQRGTAAGVIANGDRIVVIADGSTIRVYEANTLRITYTSATNFATATSAKIETLGTGGAVSDLIAYPRTLTGTPASLLDQAVS